MTYCEWVVIERDGLSHWFGFDCDRGAWVEACTRTTPEQARLVDVISTLPLCSVCLVASEILEGADR